MAIPPGFAEASIQFTLSGMTRPAFTIFGLDPSGADPAAVASSVRIAWNKVGSIGSLVDANVTMGPYVVRIGQDGGEAIVGEDPLTVAGGYSASMTPPNVALLVHKRTARGGRRGRGRMFLPWIVAETDVSEAGQIGTTELANFNTKLEVFRLELAAQLCPMVVLHEPGKTSPGAPDLVTSLRADALVATQRRRLGR